VPALLVGLVTLAVYWPALRCDFINYDDPIYVTSNFHVQKGLTLENIRWAFLNVVAANWHPLTMLSHMLDCQFFGLKPWGHHLTSVLLHSLNTVLVFLLLQRTTGAIWRSLFVAAVFGLHPLRVESVAWVAERKDVLSGCLGLLSLIFYARYAKKPPSGEGSKSKARDVPAYNARLATLDYGLALFFLALGLLSKPMLVTWPFVMLLLDYWPLQRFKAGSVRRLLVEKIPFFALVAITSVVTFLVQKHQREMVAGLMFGARTENALISYCRYLGKIFWPTDLAVLYPHPGNWPLGQVLLAGVLMGAVSFLLWVERRRHPVLLISWLWFCGMLVPVIGLVQVGSQAMADRYTYLPSLGVLILATWGAYELARHRHYLTLAVSVCGGAVILVCIGLTYVQVGYWRDSETLFRHALKVTKNNYSAHNNLGTALIQKGQIDEAIGHFQESLRLSPNNPFHLENLGICLDSKGQIDDAIQHYQEALRFMPDSAQVHHLLGVDLTKKGRIDEAITQLQEAIHLEPDDGHHRGCLGIALDSKGRIEDAVRQYQEALHLMPDSAQIHHFLGVDLGKQGHIDEAIVQLQEAIRLEPDNAMAHSDLGNALRAKGQIDVAIIQYQEAIRLKPDSAKFHYNFAMVLDQKGNTRDAILQLQEAVHFQPDDDDVHHLLGVDLARQGRIDEAILHLQEAVRLKPDDAMAHTDRGNALDSKGQIDVAILQFQQAVHLKPGNPDFHYNLGMAQNQKGESSEAIFQLQEAIRLKPDDAMAHNDLGDLLDSKGQSDAAMDQYQQAIRLAPSFPQAHANLGAALCKQGKLDEGIQELQQAIKLKPDDALPHYNLGMALEQKGRTSEAILQLQEALRLKQDFTQARELISALQTKQAPADH
jgi:Flp pilus assembly protein TadD